MAKKTKKDRRPPNRLIFDGQMDLDLHVDFPHKAKLIIETSPDEYTSYNGRARVRLDSSGGDFSFSLDRDDLKKLVVSGIRFLKGEDQGCFYHEHFDVGIGPERETFPAETILSQYPF